MKRIVFVGTSTTLGGAEKTLYTIATLLDPKKFSVAAVISLKAPGAYAAKLSEAGFRVETLGVERRPGVRDFIRLARLLRELKPDIVHAFMYQAIQLCRAVKRATRAPFALVSSPRVNYRTRSILTLAVDRALRGADALLVSESRASEDYLVRRLGYARGRVRTIHNGVDLAGWPASRLDRQQRRLELRLAADDILVGAVGRLDRQKGFRYLIDAFSRLKGRPVRCAILGEGPAREELAARVRKLKLEGQVWLIGEKQGMASWLSAFDVFVLPSLWEGLPNSLLEAMALGLPVLASDVDGVSEVVEDGVNGLLAPPKNSKVLARKIAELADNPEARRRLGQAAQKTVAEKFRLIDMISAYERTYEGLETAPS